jgi:3-hydroxyisobutyrate dehydrogenase-like beta-hydroxyacid dehydrogenase
MQPTIAILGAGRMGSALARTFLDRGYATTIWNRTEAAAAPLAARGARIAPTVRDAIARADIAIACVADYAATEQMLGSDGAAAALHGKLLVQLTSGSPSQARALAAWAARQGADYLDGAILVTPDLVGQPACTVLYAGARAAFDRADPALRALGGTARYLGEDVGQAAALDTALLACFWGAMFGALQGAAVCAAEQVPLEAYAAAIPAMMHVVAASASRQVVRIRDGRFAADATTRATVATYHAGVRHLVALCAEHDIDRSVPSAHAGLLERAVAAGHASDELATLDRFLR